MELMKSNVKPIFVCNISNKITPEEIGGIRQTLRNELKEDYYVLVVSQENQNGIFFELFNSELEDKDFEDLKTKLNIEL